MSSTELKTVPSVRMWKQSPLKQPSQNKPLQTRYPDPVVLILWVLESSGQNHKSCTFFEGEITEITFLTIKFAMCVNVSGLFPTQVISLMWWKQIQHIILLYRIASSRATLFPILLLSWLKLVYDLWHSWLIMNIEILRTDHNSLERRFMTFKRQTICIYFFVSRIF